MPQGALTCVCARQPSGDPWKGRTTIPQLSPPPSNGSAESGGWWLGREGPWYVVAVQPPLTLKELSAPFNNIKGTIPTSLDKMVSLKKFDLSSVSLLCEGPYSPEVACAQEQPHVRTY